MVYVVADEMNELFSFIEESQPPMKLSEQKKQILAKAVEAVRVAYLNSAKEMKEVKYVRVILIRLSSLRKICITCMSQYLLIILLINRKVVYFYYSRIIKY